MGVADLTFDYAVVRVRMDVGLEIERGGGDLANS